MFRTVPLYIIRSFSLYTRNGICHRDLLTTVSCQQTCMTYTIAVCKVKSSWWCTEELSEICRVLFQKQIWENSTSNWFIIRIYHDALSPERQMLIRYYRGHQIKDGEMDEACGTHEEIYIYKFLWRNLNGRNHLEVLAMDGSMILKYYSTYKKRT